MSDKMKRKKLDLRLSDSMYKEITVIAWGLEKRRSELVRDMLTYYCLHSDIVIDGQCLKWHDAVHYFEQVMEAEDLSFEDLTVKSSGEEKESVEIPDKLNLMMDELSKVHARSVKKAFDEIVRGKTND